MKKSTQKPVPINPEEEALERHVEEMMEIDAASPEAAQPNENKIAITHIAGDAPEPQATLLTSAPEITPKSKSIAIQHISAEQPTPTPVTGDKESDSLNAAIEQANQQLAEELPGSPPVTRKVKLDKPQAPEPLETAKETSEPETESMQAVETPAEPEQPRSAPVTEIPANIDSEAMPDPAADLFPAETTTAQSVGLYDAATNQAVDEIIAEESNQLVETEHQTAAPIAPQAVIHRPIEPAEQIAGEQLSFWSKFRGIFGLWWSNKVARYATLSIIILLVAAAAVYPVTRYFALNAFGVRGGASLTVIDQNTLLPIKNVQIKVANQTALTDNEGRATLNDIMLGQTQLIIEKYAYAPVSQEVTIGWGSNPFGDFRLTPVGTQYTIKVTDYLSGMPLGGVAAAAGQADARSSDQGIIKLAIDPGTTSTSIAVTLSFAGYRDEQLELDLTQRQETPVSLVPAMKALYVSNKDGIYNVYGKYIDDTDERLILAGTGLEQNNIVLVPSSDGAAAALVSTRDEQRNDEGYLLSTLTLINLKDTTTKTVTRSEQVFIVGWAGNRLIYIQTTAGSSAANPNRQRLMSYDYVSGADQQLASTNYFNDVIVTHDTVYYAPSGTYQAEGVAINFFSIKPDGSNRQTVLAKETWGLFRTGYNTIIISIANQEWYDLTIGATPNRITGSPGPLTSRVYIDSPDGKRSAWVDTRDGRGILTVVDTEKNEEKTLLNTVGLSSPLYWLNTTTLVYRVVNSKDTVDYAVSVLGGEPQEISEVVATSGIERWYSY